MALKNSWFLEQLCSLEAAAWVDAEQITAGVDRESFVCTQRLPCAVSDVDAPSKRTSSKRDVRRGALNMYPLRCHCMDHAWLCPGIVNPRTPLFPKIPTLKTDYLGIWGNRGAWGFTILECHTSIVQSVKKMVTVVDYYVSNKDHLSGSGFESSTSGLHPTAKWLPKRTVKTQQTLIDYLGPDH
eukprot:76342-Amphidinium_carterae.1